MTVSPTETVDIVTVLLSQLWWWAVVGPPTLIPSAIERMGQVMEAINRQLAHYPYHVGQIVYIGKMQASNWQSLSIPKGNSAQFNADKFAQDKHLGHFTDEFLNQNDAPEK